MVEIWSRNFQKMRQKLVISTICDILYKKWEIENYNFKISKFWKIQNFDEQPSTSQKVKIDWVSIDFEDEHHQPRIRSSTCRLGLLCRWAQYICPECWNSWVASCRLARGRERWIQSFHSSQWTKARCRTWLFQAANM